jgi:hypothetical protein
VRTEWSADTVQKGGVGSTFDKCQTPFQELEEGGDTPFEEMEKGVLTPHGASRSDAYEFANPLLIQPHTEWPYA